MLPIVALLAGCPKQEVVRLDIAVNSLSAAAAIGKRYVLRPAGSDVDVGSLEFREYAGYIHGALADHGYTRATDPSQADLIIHLSFGIRPVETGAHLSTTHSYGPFGSEGAARAVKDVEYLRWIELSALDLHRFRRDKARVEIWNTSASSQGSSNDLRRVFPALVAVARAFFNRDSKGTVTIPINADDEQIAHVRSRAQP